MSAAELAPAATAVNLVRVAESAQPPGTGELLELIEEMVTMEETFNKYYSAEQLDRLTRRREQLGEQAITDARGLSGPA
ncbi:MAG: hypothetical protein ACR2G2_02070 [Pseudonocardia sp.]